MTDSDIAESGSERNECPLCGHGVYHTWNFCPNCARPLREDEPLASSDDSFVETINDFERNLVRLKEHQYTYEVEFDTEGVLTRLECIGSSDTDE